MRCAMHARTGLLVVPVVGVIVLGAVNASVRADDEQAPPPTSQQPSYQPLYQDYSGNVPQDPTAAATGVRPAPAAMSVAGSPTGGNIIGYQPMNASEVNALQRHREYQQPRGFEQLPTYDYTMWLVGAGPYTLGRDDVIRIQVRNQPDFSGDFAIGPDGTIQYNYIGDIPMAGMTKYEVEQVITQFVEPYVRVPQVTVAIVAYNSKAIYVIGEVNRPGKFLMRGDTIKLREAIVAAGLPTRIRAAMYRTQIVKPDPKHPVIRKINLRRLLYKGKIANDIDLYPGEVIVVPTNVLGVIGDFFSELFSPLGRVLGIATRAGAGI